MKISSRMPTTILKSTGTSRCDDSIVNILISLTRFSVTSQPCSCRRFLWISQIDEKSASGRVSIWREDVVTEIFVALNEKKMFGRGRKINEHFGQAMEQNVDVDVDLLSRDASVSFVDFRLEEKRFFVQFRFDRFELQLNVLIRKNSSRQ